MKENGLSHNGGGCRSILSLVFMETNLLSAEGITQSYNQFLSLIKYQYIQTFYWPKT